ncbi:MAG TPA: TolC family protein, partial [Gammaproteobacteria bacterium]
MSLMNCRRALLGVCLLWTQAAICGFASAETASPDPVRQVIPSTEQGSDSQQDRAARAANPLTLQQAISAALQSNPQLRAFAFQFRAGDARTRQAALRPAPEASVDLENFAGSGEARGLDASESTFALSQVIELGGKREARIGAAQAGRDALDIERQAVQLDVE